MPFPIDLTRCLAFAASNTPLKLCTIPFEGLRARLAGRGLHGGDEITCETNSEGHVLVVTADGRRVLVEREYAVVLEVSPAVAAATPSTTPHRAVRQIRRAIAV